MLQILYKFFNTTVSNSMFSLWSEWRGGWERSQGLNLLIQCMPCLLVTEISVFMSHIIIWRYDTRVTLLVGFNRARYNFWRARLQSDIWCMQSGCKLSKNAEFSSCFFTSLWCHICKTIGHGSKKKSNRVLDNWQLELKVSNILYTLVHY